MQKLHRYGISKCTWQIKTIKYLLGAYLKMNLISTEVCELKTSLYMWWNSCDMK